MADRISSLMDSPHRGTVAAVGIGAIGIIAGLASVTTGADVSTRSLTKIVQATRYVTGCASMPESTATLELRARIATAGVSDVLTDVASMRCREPGSNANSEHLDGNDNQIVTAKTEGRPNLRAAVYSPGGSLDLVPSVETVRVLAKGMREVQTRVDPREFGGVDSKNTVLLERPFTDEMSKAKQSKPLAFPVTIAASTLVAAAIAKQTLDPHRRRHRCP